MIIHKEDSSTTRYYMEQLLPSIFRDDGLEITHLAYDEDTIRVRGYSSPSQADGPNITKDDRYFHATLGIEAGTEENGYTTTYPIREYFSKYIADRWKRTFLAYMGTFKYWDVSVACTQWVVCNPVELANRTIRIRNLVSKLSIEFTYSYNNDDDSVGYDFTINDVRVDSMLTQGFLTPLEVANALARIEDNGVTFKLSDTGDEEFPHTVNIIVHQPYERVILKNKISDNLLNNILFMAARGMYPEGMGYLMRMYNLEASWLWGAIGDR